MMLMRVLKSRLSPFRHKHFRNFFAVQSLSLVGTWMQELAKSWIVINLVGTTAAVGALLFAAALPNLILGAWGGVLADRKGAKRTLVITQFGLAICAFALGLIVTTGNIEFWHLLVFAVVEGSFVAFDAPAFAQVTPRLVPKEDFQQALALNSVNFHTARVLGPSVAGTVMSVGGGPASVFWINAVTFLFVVWVISRVPIEDIVPGKARAQVHMREVFQYLKDHPLFSRIFLQFLVIMVLVFPLVFTTFRTFMKDRFSLSEAQFGIVFSAPGLGALLGSLCFLLLKPRNPIVVLTPGILGLTTSIVFVAESPNLAMASLALVTYSFSMFLTLSALLTTVQLRVDDKLRGRISALVAMAFTVVAPMMSVPIGALADGVGARFSLWIVSGLCLLCSAALALSARSYPDSMG
jgi:MFS family permease